MDKLTESYRIMGSWRSNQKKLTYALKKEYFWAVTKTGRRELKLKLVVLWKSDSFRFILSTPKFIKFQKKSDKTDFQENKLTISKPTDERIIIV